MKNFRSLQYLPYFIISYMLMAFIWWAILLYDKNEQVFLSKMRILELQEELQVKSSNFEKSNFDFQAIKAERERQNRMVIGEVLVFCLALIIGIYLINRAHTREIQAANQQKNFLLSITHELKSPIASIKLALETFLKRDLDHDQVKKLGSGALKETNRLNELVNDLLLSARLETAYKPNFEPVDMKILTQKICSDFSNNHPELILSRSFTKDLMEINADRKGMEIIISNLLENSLKYNFSNPKKVELSISSSPGFLNIEVADNGSGINDSDKKRVFEKFYRSGNEDTRKTKGTGLGLYIVREILKSHGGKISIKDNQPEGTVFLMNIPT